MSADLQNAGDVEALRKAYKIAAVRGENQELLLGRALESHGMLVRYALDALGARNAVGREAEFT